MNIQMTTLLLVGVFTVTLYQQASGGNTYNFVGIKHVGLPPADVERPILAVLKLSGESPFDHTSIESLTFTPEAGSFIGYVGEYAGSFDSSSLTFLETPEGGLVSSIFDGGSTTEAAGVFDENPTPFNAGNVTLNNSSVLHLYFGSPDFDYLSVTGTQSLERNFIPGVWTKIIPEPNSIALFATGFLGTLIMTGLISTEYSSSTAFAV